MKKIIVTGMALGLSLVAVAPVLAKVSYPSHPQTPVSTATSSTKAVDKPEKGDKPDVTKNAGAKQPPAQSGVFRSNLKVGSRGADVTLLQNDLGVSPATGYFGPITKAAVITYQRAHGLPSTGFVGPLTRAKLNAGSQTP